MFWSIFIGCIYVIGCLIAGIIINKIMTEEISLSKLPVIKQIKTRKQLKEIFKKYSGNRKWDNGHINNCNYYKCNCIDMPRLTFERWKIFYDNKPESWYIDNDLACDDSYAPCYIKKKDGKTICLPIFWTNVKELHKYVKWIEKEYRNNKEIQLTKARDKNFRDLVTYLEEDIKEQKERARIELEKYMEGQSWKYADEKFQKAIHGQSNDGCLVLEEEAKKFLENPILKIGTNEVRTSTPSNQIGGIVKSYNNKHLCYCGEDLTGHSFYMDTTTGIYYIFYDGQEVVIPEFLQF